MHFHTCASATVASRKEPAQLLGLNSFFFSFFMDYHVHLKEMKNYGHSDLGSWQGHVLKN